MYHPHRMYSFCEAADIALAPLLSFVEMVGSTHPEAAAVGQAVVAQSRKNLTDIGTCLSGVCAAPSGLVFTGYQWENERCRECGKKAGCLPAPA